MRVDAFDFTLPEELIALRPARPRSDAQLVVAGEGDLAFDRFRGLADHLRPGDILVFNDTKVIPARLSGVRRRGEAVAKIEATLIERKDDARWIAFAKPGKRLKPGDVIGFGALSAEVEAKGDGGAVTLAFDRAGPALDAAIAAVGAPPLPPYIAARREIDAEDERDYQTRFARRPGAVAAPTASLHFDDLVMERLAERGVRQATLTLHVGAGTFTPVSAERTEDHKMHAEWGEIDAKTAAAITEARAEGGRVIAAGTTALRVLETAAAGGALAPWRGDTNIFITPGYRFQAVDGLITNFHLPRSTLFMLVSAFIGLDRAQALYAEAIRRRMRFYSYGDGSLLWRANDRKS